MKAIIVVNILMIFIIFMIYLQIGQIASNSNFKIITQFPLHLSLYE